MNLSSTGVRRMGIWSAATLSSFGIVYFIIGIIGASSGGSFWPPRQIDPFLATMETIILLMGPFMVTLMVSVHTFARDQQKIYSLVALCFMTLAAGTTCTMQYIRLSILRSMHSGELLTSLRDLILYVDLLAWDFFFGLSMLFAAVTFNSGNIEKRVRFTMTFSGSLCLAGFLGPVTGNLNLQSLAIAGYTIVFIIVCLLLVSFFRQADQKK
jgi:hypothetical protein